VTFLAPPTHAHAHAHFYTHLYTHTHLHPQEGGVKKRGRKKGKRRLRVRKIRGDGREEVSTPKAHNPLDPLLLRRFLFYPLSFQPLNQQGGTQFKHLTPRLFSCLATHYSLTQTLSNATNFNPPNTVEENLSIST
jgi:hypothetical protein